LNKIIYITILSLLTIFIWAQLYRAQFLVYDENFGLLILIFILSAILFVAGIILLFRKAKIVRDNLLLTIAFLLLNSPFVVVIVVLNYRQIFGVALKVG
jgi:ABC-type spermidine/putrescine transport system permease subunit II